MADPADLQGGEAAAWLLGPILGVEFAGGARWRPVSVKPTPMMPPLHGERMPLYARTVREITDHALEVWPVGRPFPLHHEMRAIVLDVFLRTIFGLEEPQRERLRDRQGRILKMADSPSAGFIFLPTLRVDLGRFSPMGAVSSGFEARQIASNSPAEIARCRTQGDADRTYVLSLLVAARDEDGNPMSEQELFDEMFTLLMAGIETTTTSLVWIPCCDLLGRPDVQGKISRRARGRSRRRAPGGEAYRRAQGPRRRHEGVGSPDAGHDRCRSRGEEADANSRRHRPSGRCRRISGNLLDAHRPNLRPDPDRFDPDRFTKQGRAPIPSFPLVAGIGDAWGRRSPPTS